MRTAVECEVQAVGFVFARSPRAVSLKQAARLARALPESVAAVAVMLRPDQAQVDEVLAGFTPDYLQADWQSTRHLELPSSVQALPVYREGDGASLADLPQRFVYEGQLSGQGETVDWQAARTIADKRDMVLAGGLNPENVADAVRTLHPFGVDVSSGIERSRGVKDAERMHAFVHAVRQVDHELSTDRVG